MKVIVGLDFFADGLDEDNMDEVRNYIREMIESGAESTCSSSGIDGIYPAEEYTVVKKSELEKLEAAEEKLDALEAMGVDNWSGYSDAMRALKEGLEDY
jgi:hypothetical protein